MTALLSRYAESMFWFGRYTERAACLARIMEVQASLSRGSRVESSNWSWIVRLYDDSERFAQSYTLADSRSVIRFYASDRENPGSIISTIHAARENARALRAMISTDLWLQVNSFYNRFRNLPEQAHSESRIAQTAEMVKKEAYAQLGVANATLYRDAAWHFYTFGVLIERADQMSRLLDVRFMQLAGNGAADDGDPLGDFGFWSVLLRSAASQQAFLRIVRGHREPATVARFLIFNRGLPRSISYCVAELEHGINELRSHFEARSTSAAHQQIDVLQQSLAQAEQDPRLVERLHEFNDTVQKQLIELSSEFAYTFFDVQRPEPEDIVPVSRDGEGGDQRPSQHSKEAKSGDQISPQSQSQSQSQGSA
jgi:uncharacterized alpha-E superfamily protein